MLGDELQAADRANVTVLAGRGFVDAELVLAAQPPERVARHRRGDGEGRGMRFAAGAARAQSDAQA
jgi:hypothetical protein